MKKGTSKHFKALPIHIACVTGNKGALKSIVSTLPKRGLETKDCLGRTPLILTVSKNYLDCCAILLKAGATVDNTDNAGQTALHIAASKGLHQFVKLLLQFKASWIQRDYSGATALHMASVHLNVKGLLLIAKYVKPAEIDIQDSTLKTALHWSAAYTCNNNIKALLALGANPCIPDEGGKTPLHYAAANSNLEALACVKTLVKNESRLINWQDYEGRSPLHIAVTSGNEELVYYLASVEHCNVDIIDNCFLTPLHYAAKRGLAEKADILLKKRASHLSIDDNGAMPLHYAAYNNHAETVEVFANKSYICDEPDHLGRSALMWAAIKNSMETLKILLSTYKTSYADKNGYTALHVAAIYGNIPAVKLLINGGFYIDSKDKSGMTPFLKACEFGRSKTAETLLSFGANMDVKDINSSSALHWCARGGHAYLADILIKHGADYNIKDKFRMTPLHYVSLSGDFVNCTCVLVESGADLNATDIEGKTPLHCAVLNDRCGIVKYLCEYDINVNAMFLMKNDWVTPYDCAMLRSNMKITVVLEKCGGIQAHIIKEYALNLIQSWYKRKKRLTSKSSSIIKKSSNTSCSWHVKPNPVSTAVCQICTLTDKRDLFLICNKCFQKYSQHHISKNDHLALDKKATECCRFSSRSLSVLVPDCKLSTSCNKPSSCSSMIHLDDIACKTSFFHVRLKETIRIGYIYSILRDKSARIIQKAWKKYKLKKNFLRVRNEARLSFINYTDRTIAEKIWQLKLQTFFVKHFKRISLV